LGSPGNARTHAVDTGQDVIRAEVEDIRLVAATHDRAAIHARPKIDPDIADLLPIRSAPSMAMNIPSLELSWFSTEKV